MEAVRHALGERDLGDVAAVEVLGVEHDELGAVVVGTSCTNVTSQPSSSAVALGPADEHRLAGAAAGAVVEQLPRSPVCRSYLNVGHSRRIASTAGAQ